MSKYCNNFSLSSKFIDLERNQHARGFSVTGSTVVRGGKIVHIGLHRRTDSQFSVQFVCTEYAVCIRQHSKHNGCLCFWSYFFFISHLGRGSYLIEESIGEIHFGRN